MTKHREPNKVKWVGVRPGHNGEQIHKSGRANNDTVILYTVPADKILLLFNWGISTFWTALNTYVSLGIYDAVPAIETTLVDILMQVIGDTYDREASYDMPIELPEDYSLRLVSGAIGCYISGYVHGILVDV